MPLKPVRHGHGSQRTPLCPLAVAYGAKIFDDKGKLVIDDGYKTAAKKFVDWNKRPDAQGSLGASAVHSIAMRLKNSPMAGRHVLLRFMANQPHGQAVSKNFDWAVAPHRWTGSLYRHAAGAFVAFKRTKNRRSGEIPRLLASDTNYAD